MIKRRWHFLAHDVNEIAALKHSIPNLNPTLAKILLQRGINTFEKAKAFFNPSLDQLNSPWLMKDMDKAVQRIIHAINSKEKIMVFGDYDVDGTTAVAITYQFLCRIYESEKLDFYIPHRYKEGYGVSKAGIDFAAANGFGLIIALDCGIKSVELIEYATTLGIDFIICDHHLPGSILPAATAILNAKQPGCHYPFKELCGCGVGFKLICALAEKINVPLQVCFEYLDLVATAIAADIVPMNGENRILAYYGLQKINRQPSAGIKALLQTAGIDKEITINNVVFIIAPRVNAAGRMDDAKKAVQLFIEKDADKAEKLATLLQEDNSERKLADSTITEEALTMLRTNEAFAKRKSSVVFKENWHKGVVGIVASRLMEHVYKPTIVLTKSGEFITGSARSVQGFNLYDAIYECREYLVTYGGHFAAAGLTLQPEKLEAFTAKFDEVVSSTIDDQLLIPQINIDAEIEFKTINEQLLNTICRMEPFGPENMRPVFVTKNVRDTGYSQLLKDKHLKLHIKKNETAVSAIGFNMADYFPLIENGNPVDIAYHIEFNEWNGNKTIQLRIIDIKASE